MLATQCWECAWLRAIFVLVHMICMLLLMPVCVPVRGSSFTNDLWFKGHDTGWTSIVLASQCWLRLNASLFVYMHTVKPMRGLLGWTYIMRHVGGIAGDAPQHQNPAEPPCASLLPWGSCLSAAVHATALSFGSVGHREQTRP